MEDGGIYSDMDCFIMEYMLQLMTNGYERHSESIRNDFSRVHFNNKINGDKISWTLGLLVNTISTM